MKNGTHLLPNSSVLRHFLLITFLLVSAIMLMVSCKKQNSLIPETDNKVFGDYWFRGKAEISSYALRQSRNGTIHDGQTIMVFVTEDFSKSQHVKLDEPHRSNTDAVRVLKLNTQKKFVTGIHNYSLMNSVYMPLDHSEYPHSFKLTSSIQEWSGQSFMQAEWKSNRYDIQQFSTVEPKGDSKFSLAQCWLEDELWALIRIAPNTLPLGEIKMIVSAFYLHLSHKENKVYNATTSLVKAADHYTYSILYPELHRKMEIEFELIFPYRILGWKESDGSNEVSSGRLQKTMMSDYWVHNQDVDETLRDSLQLIN
jgi:hypothetical protein